MSYTLTGTDLDAPDANALAGFYRRLLGWVVVEDEPGWVVLQMHLDIGVDDLDAAVTQAVALGATLAGFQPQKAVRVCLDPAG